MSERIHRAAAVLAGIWIVGTMFVYCVRFTAVLYRTHHADIDAFAARMGALFGLN